MIWNWDVLAEKWRYRERREGLGSKCRARSKRVGRLGKKGRLTGLSSVRAKCYMRFRDSIDDSWLPHVDQLER